MKVISIEQFIDEFILGGEMSGDVDKYGITRDEWEKYRKENGNVVDFGNMSKDDAKSYIMWLYNKTNIHRLIYPVNLAALDFYFHSRASAIKVLQRAMNILTGVNSLYIDGIIGDRTAGYLNTNFNTPSKIRELLIQYCSDRISFYVSIVTKNESLRKYLKSWTTRVNKLRDYLLGLISDVVLRVPDGYNEIVAMFGEPGAVPLEPVRVPELLIPRFKYDGRPVSIFYAHRLMVPLFTTVLNAIVSNGLTEHISSYDGCFNHRMKRGSKQLSTHSWGIAIDINAALNPMGSKPTMNEGIVKCFEDAGFVWGGRWSVPDGMHFQYARNY